MPESLKNDEKSIRSYILNDVLEKIPIDKSYENLCKVIGNVAIAFYDFQYWFYRLLGGNRDLEFDRSSEPEPLQFSDLPVDAVGLIVDKLEVVDRLMLRKVSKPLQKFVERQEIDCSYVEVSCGSNLIYVSYESGGILYAKNEKAVKLSGNSYFIHDAEQVLYGDYYDSEAFNDLAWILKNPKLQINSFEFWPLCVKNRVVSKFLNKLNVALKSLKHQISVQQLSLQPEHPDDVLAILPYLKPGYLKKISISARMGNFDWKNDENSRKVEQIMQLDQWKQAKELHLLDALHLFPEEVLLQFNNYIIHTQLLDQDQLDRIKMMFASSPVFEKCTFLFCIPSEREDSLDFIGAPGPPIRYYLIPNTDKLLVFKEFTFGDIEIVKKTRVVQ